MLGGRLAAESLSVFAVYSRKHLDSMWCQHEPGCFETNESAEQKKQRRMGGESENYVVGGYFPTSDRRLRIKTTQCGQVLWSSKKERQGWNEQKLPNEVPGYSGGKTTKKKHRRE